MDRKRLYIESVASFDSCIMGCAPDENDRSIWFPIDWWMKVLFPFWFWRQSRFGFWTWTWRFCWLNLQSVRC